MRDSVFISVEGFFDDNCYLFLEYGVQEFDDDDQVVIEDQQGDDQQDDVNSKIRKVGIYKDVLV